MSYREDASDRFLSALAIELEEVPPGPPPPTIYVGGGTPSALRESQLERLLALLAPYRSPGQELTFEVNPRSATREKLDLLAAGGVSRVSFGAQTFDAERLKLLGRRHGTEDIGRVYSLLRERIPSISFDLIFSLPGQTLEEWEVDLTRALELRPDHLSVYSLIYEPGTPLTLQVERGELQRVDEELERSMYLRTIDHFTTAGYELYEVSSFALPGHRAEHNMSYWRQEPYRGVGPGAVSTLGRTRTQNDRNLAGYVQGLLETGRPPRHVESLTDEEILREHLLLRLRTAEGLSRQTFRELAGVDLEEYSEGRLGRLLALGHLAEVGDQLLLTREGRCVADRVISELFASAAS